MPLQAWIEDVGRAVLLAKGDSECWRSWVPECRSLIGRVATSCGLGPEARLDVEQTVLAAFWEKRGNVFNDFLGRSSLATYLYSAVAWHVRRARSSGLLSAHRCRFVDPDRLAHRAGESIVTPDEAAARTGASGRNERSVAAMLGTLPPRQLEVVILARTGLSWARVAASAGITRDAARKSFAKALLHLSASAREKISSPFV